MKKIYLFSFILTLFTIQLNAQRNCSSMDVLHNHLQESPKLQDKMDRIEKATSAYIKKNASSRVDGVITIPVVFHVVYNNSTENISDAQLNDQLQILNEDFRRQNSDADNVWSQAADTEFEFCLASVDPNGNSTSGITRTSTSRTSFGTNDAVKFASSGGKDAWPAADYLNIWICDIGGGILGYAQFPGGSPSTDGVVNDYRYTGSIGTATAPFNLGRTLTHEVGHYLNLRHIWGDGGCGVDDFVSDTPTSDASNGGCNIGHVSCGTTDMVQNYMDYSDDACMNLFTTGQKARMRALFDNGGARVSLLSSGACGTPSTPTCNDGIQNGNETGVDCGGSCAPCQTGCSGTEVSISITLDNYPEETSWVIRNSSGSAVASGGTYGSQPDGSTVTITECLSDGCYDFIISDTYGDGICCSYGNGSYTVSGGGSTLASGGNFGSSETTNFCLGGSTGPTCDDGIQNGGETGVDCGGSCAPCQTGCSQVSVDSENFESGFGIWNDGGSDCFRYSSTTYANSGSYSVVLRDNTNSSTTTTDNLNLSGFEEVTIDFTYYPLSMENGEDFWLQASTNGGSSYQTISTWASGTDFTNNNREFESVTITGTFTSNTRFRFRCDASTNSDYIIIDDVDISGCSNGSREVPITEEFIAEPVDAISSVKVYPNPTTDVLNINYDLQADAQVQINVLDMSGRSLMNSKATATAGRNASKLNVSNLKAGIYYVQMNTGEEQIVKKFVVIE